MNNQLKEARHASGLTQKEMSELLLIPLRTIENWESGKRRPPIWAERLIVEKLQQLYTNERTIRQIGKEWLEQQNA